MRKKNKRLSVNKIIVALFIICIFIGCNSNIFSKSEEKPFTISGKEIVFYTISQTEYDRRKNEDGIDEVLSDFNYYASIVMDSLKNCDIKCAGTVNSNIEVYFGNKEKSSITIDTSKHIVAIIFSNGIDKPIVEYGVLSSVDIFQIINDYYGDSDSGK